MNDQVLAKIDKARVYLMEAKTASQVQHVIALADAARIYGKQVGASTEAINYASEIRVRAERKLGEILKETPKNPGVQMAGSPKGQIGGAILEPPISIPTLAENGISRKLSSRAQQLASVPDDEFEKAVTATPDQEISPVSVVSKLLSKLKHSRAMSLVEEQTRQKKLDATITHASYAEWLLTLTEECDLLLTDPPYSTDVKDVVLFAHDWLPHALDSVKSTGRAYVCIGAYPHELNAYLSVPIPDHIQLVQVLVWTYKNTLGPTPKFDYKQNWQAILYFRGSDAPALNCPLMTEQFTVMEFNHPAGLGGDRYHAWQKPNELGERLVRHSTQPGDVVIDPFAGTGTFLLAAAKLGRVALGCDADRAQVDLAIKRGCYED